MRYFHFASLKSLAAGLLLTLTLGAVGWCDNPMLGKWKTTNGGHFKVPASQGKFTLVLETATKEKIEFPAQWTKLGEEFTWVDKQNSLHHARFDSKYKVPRIKDVGEAHPDSPAFWYQP